jgi:hypothetical protein
MRSIPVLLLLVVAAAAKAPSLVAPVTGGDADLGTPLPSSFHFRVAYVDANGNGRVDSAAPDEPVYLDVDGSQTVSYGDIRLTEFHYPAGTVVDLGNRDFGLKLSGSGVLARAGSLWFADTDSTLTVSPSDVRLDSFTKVLAGDADLGAPLDIPPSARGALWWHDADGDGRRGAMETLYVDMDPYAAGLRGVTVGDLRIVPGPFGVDDYVREGDLAGLVPPAASPEAPLQAAVPVAQAEAGWRTLDWILVVVGVANLAGLVIVGRLAAARHPRNPF